MTRLPPATEDDDDDGAIPPKTPSRPKAAEEEDVTTKKPTALSFPPSSSAKESHGDPDSEEEKREVEADVSTKEPATVPLPPSIGKPTASVVNGSPKVNDGTTSPSSSKIPSSSSRSAITTNSIRGDSKLSLQQQQQHLSPRLSRFRAKLVVPELAASVDNVDIVTGREVKPGAVAVGSVEGLGDMPLRDSFRATVSEPSIEAHLAPDEAEVEARIVERIEDEITRKVEERLTSDIAVATEVRDDLCGLTKTTIGFLVILVLLTIGGIVGGIVYSLRDKEDKALPIQAATSAPIMPVDDPLVEELKAWIVPTEEDFIPFGDPNSAQSQALDWLHSDPIAMSTNRTSETLLQRYVLSVLYFATSGSGWLWPYLSSDDVCTWNLGSNDTGVFCDTDGESVDRIEMSYNNLRGTIPWELVLLTNLQSVNFDNNRLSGSIPSRINELTQLQIFWAMTNDLTGPLPPTFAPSVANIDVGENALTGTIPTLWATSMPDLDVLSLFLNRLTGTIPSELGVLDLIRFSFFGNVFTGSVNDIFCGGSVWPELSADCEEVHCRCCAICCYDDQLKCNVN